MHLDQIDNIFQFCPDSVQTQICFWSGPDWVQILVWTNSGQIWKIFFKSCPDPVQTRVWYQTKIWTPKNPDSGQSLDLYRWWTPLARTVFCRPKTVYFSQGPYILRRLYIFKNRIFYFLIYIFSQDRLFSAENQYQ